MCLVDQHVLGRAMGGVGEVVAEPVGGRFEHCEGIDICLFLRGVGATRGEGNLHLVAGIAGRLLDRG